MYKTNITADQALEGFGKGIVCSQATFANFAEQMGIDRETALKLASPYGGGSWRGEQCGCVVGGLMAIGLKYGQGDVFDHEKDEIMKAKSQEFMTRFADAYGSCICREILVYDISIPEEAAKIMEENKFGNVCCKAVVDACDILVDVLGE